jgi:hypothetical protein
LRKEDRGPHAFSGEPLAFCASVPDRQDLPILHSLSHIPSFLHTRGVEPKTVRSSPLFWRWIRNSFHVFYIIEVAEDSGRRIIGFAGLYHMEIRKSLWLSLALLTQKTEARDMGDKPLDFSSSFFKRAMLYKRSMPRL